MKTKTALLGIASAVLMLFASRALATSLDPDMPDVVVIVDTSTTMKQPGMDSERSSLLFTKLLSDIVPGDLAVIRLLDLHSDAAVLPSTRTGKTEPCQEDPSRVCNLVEPAEDWGQKARRERLGVMERPAIGDTAFKKELDFHLAQRSGNSQFYLSFWAATGVFEAHAAAGKPRSNRTVIWLSDGKDESGPALAPAVLALRSQGVEIVTIIFGRGDPTIPRDIGLDVDTVSSPADLMRAFAHAFRGIVNAPYRIDNLLAEAPEFEMRENVDEAWVVVYGDKTLRDVTVTGPGGAFVATYASDSWADAGAYQVAHFDDPTPGTWRVAASGGGPGVAYAVVQRSSLAPVLLEPEHAPAETRQRIVAAVTAKKSAVAVTDPLVLQGARIRASIGSQSMVLTDDGQNADETAGDGRFSVFHTFSEPGKVPVELTLDSPLVTSTRRTVVNVAGVFRASGGSIAIDLGHLSAPATACRPLSLAAEHLGKVPFVLESLQALPPEHSLFVRAGNTVIETDSEPRDLEPGVPLELCLTATERAPTSSGNGLPWLLLKVADSTAAHQQVRLDLTWELQGLTFWQRWGWLVLTALATLTTIFIALGFILPHRLQRSLAVSFAPERDDVDENAPQAVSTWRGVGIGFYRNARAYLHADFRLSGKRHGALAALCAEAHATRVLAGKGLALYRENYDGTWETVPETGEAARAGEVYRIGDNGPYFRIALRRG